MRKRSMEERVQDARKFAFDNKGMLCIIAINENAVEAHFLGEAIQFQPGTDTKAISKQAIDWAIELREQRHYEPKISMKMLV